MNEAGGRRRLSSKFTSNFTNENLNLQLISLAEPRPCPTIIDDGQPVLKENEMEILEKSKARVYLLLERNMET